MATGSPNIRASDGLIKVVVPSMVLTFAVGTGGDLAEYVRLCDAQFPVEHGQPDQATHDLINVATAAADLARIKSVLKISTTDLANALGVSRTAIYNWKSGQHIKPGNLSKLANLKAAADAFVLARFTVSSQMLDRTLPGGKTFLERIAEGMDGSEAASSLIGILHTDAERRREMDALLAENISRVANSSDYGAPAFRED